MRSILAAVLPLLVLSGCASYQSDEVQPVPADRLLAYQEMGQGSVKIDVSRDVGFLGGGCYVALTIDQQVAARIGAGESASFHVPAGQHVVGIIGDKDGDGLCSKAMLRRELLMTLEEGSDTRLRINSDNRKGFDIKPATE
ncbi:3-isopropylmalate dehydratase [Pseudomonas sp. ZM23]|uniref:3-isopropylmalate dehydratase n=1 Tax=Pseudomonas triclosanedens TaxID=2961893 RepID=A0ABY7A2F5_9PSED|nr:3-isopropylmalate dehydratase [Pseudomonas triclosanedens]MCP8464316.1 3-isopropylmalate dehydratase [Pseudomonas triclosanedens]MCP8471450.1 3-isopropylmalate dehydratase [Pseudomonas triclosanedens]MCP8477741.1 3-isopropylmalate dehydratase [Pseudomonas triclosanedens]WAI51196.1 3-isopropylmalate dehydratase [Pseudomonas triclosanedens]